jgi:glycosyltransferase involved in cell wall biosynthesis
MAKVDLHVHSRYSAHPSEWFLQRLGTRESYTDPETIYRTALERGMSFVTITDHNEVAGALALKAKYPGRVIAGVEATAYFPEDHCKVHVLVYDVDQADYIMIEKLRADIYQLRDFIREKRFAHSVAHPTYSVNSKLTRAHVEKLLLLFDVFEAQNGSRSKNSNGAVAQVLQSLTPEHIEDMYNKHRIEPFSDTPWLKGITGGSDDHGGIFIGNTYTAGHGETVEEFLESLKNKHTVAGGNHNDFRGLAFAIYKVAYDFSKSRSNSWTSSFLNTLNALVFEPESLGLRSKVLLKKFKSSKAVKDDAIKRALFELVESFQKGKDLTVLDKLSMVYDSIACISDTFFVNFADALSSDIQNSDLVGLIKSVTSAMPGLFLSAPFFSSINELFRSRDLLTELTETYCADHSGRSKRIMWFSDTVGDLNGVSETLKKLGWYAHERGLSLRLAACMLESDRRDDLPPNLLELPCIYTYTSSVFDTYTLRMPSVLSSLKAIYDADPDEIYISTPGPVGLLGLLAARLLHVPCRMVYHTDFTRQAHQIIGDETVCRLVEEYTRWFYSLADEIRVPSREYIEILEQRRFNRAKMGLFRRGIETDTFEPHSTPPDYLQRRYGVAPGATLLYAGRISKEKNVDFLLDVYFEVLKEMPDTNLICAGDGPYFDEFRKKTAAFERIHALGRVDRAALTPLYARSDCFLFPSTTDTFGMVILEAQACGLPAIVSDFGGPKEIIVNGKTGFVAHTNNAGDWALRIKRVLNMADCAPDQYQEMRSAARQHVLELYSWDAVLDDIFGRKRAQTRKPSTPASAKGLITA